MKGDHVGLAGSLLEGDRASPALDDRRVAEQGIGSQYVAAESAESARDSTADPAEPDDRPAERTHLATPYGAPVAGSCPAIARCDRPPSRPQQGQSMVRDGGAGATRAAGAPPAVTTG